MRWRTSSVGGLLLVASVLVSCGEESTSPVSDTSPTLVATTAAPQETDPPAVTGAAPETEVPPEPEASAQCDAAVMLPVLDALFPDNALWNIVDIDIEDCQGGYARVFAIVDQSVCEAGTEPCLENEQVFLVDVGGSWQYLDSGTGIECADPSGLTAETVAACEALGLA